MKVRYRMTRGCCIDKVSRLLTIETYHVEWTLYLCTPTCWLLCADRALMAYSLSCGTRLYPITSRHMVDLHCYQCGVTLISRMKLQHPCRIQTVMGLTLHLGLIHRLAFVLVCSGLIHYQMLKSAWMICIADVRGVATVPCAALEPAKGLEKGCEKKRLPSKHHILWAARTNHCQKQKKPPRLSASGYSLDDEKWTQLISTNHRRDLECTCNPIDPSLDVYRDSSEAPP